MMRPGRYVLMDGKAWEVLELGAHGDVHIRDTDDPLKSKWVDYYLVEIIDPTRNPEALLEAMATIIDDPDVEPEEGGAHVEPAPELF